MRIRTRWRHFARLWLPTLWLGAGFVVAMPASGAPAHEEYLFELDGAMPDPAAGLTLIAETVGGRWEPVVWGHARVHDDMANHFGRIVESDGARDGKIRLRIELLFGRGREPRAIPPADLTLEFSVREGAVGGVWKGTAWGAAGSGAVTGSVHVMRGATDVTPPAPGEHPRLLIRRTDIPALQARARTPFGEAMMARLAAEDPLSLTRMAVGQGLLYVLTGEKGYAEKAVELLETDYSSGKWVRTEVHYPYVPVHDAGSTAVEAAIAFDLVYDACDEPFRKAMLDLFARRAEYLYRAPANGRDSSNWSAIYRSGAGMAALLALEVAPGGLPEPAAPGIKELKPPADLGAGDLGADVPLVEFDGGELTSWLTGGPLFGRIGQDLLDPLGQPPYRPHGGMEIASKATIRWQGQIRPVHNEGKSAFRIHSDKNGPIPWPYDVKGLAGGTTRMLYFYCVLNVRSAGAFAVKCTTGRITDYRVLIADQAAKDGDIVRLKPGRYPVLLAVEPGDNRRAHKIMYRFWLDRIGEEDAKSKLAVLHAEHADECALRRFWSDAAVRGGCANPMAAYWLGMARMVAGNYLRWDIGNLGFNMEGEAYTQHSLRALLPFAHCYRNATGKPLIGGPNPGMILPGYVARTIFRADHAAFLGYSTGGAPLGVDNYARGFALVPDEFKRAVLWAWDRTQALADAGMLKSPYQPVDFLDPMSAAFLFVNHPADMAEQNPSEALPRVAVDSQLGGYVFRNRWRDGDDICATVFLNHNAAGGSWAGYDSGDFRISGLGVDWAVRGRGNGVGGDQDNTVGGDFNKPFPGMPLASWDAPVTRFEAREDGSGVLSFNMDRVYLGMKPDPRGAKPVAMAPGMCRGKPIAYDWGVRGTRSFAVDYSGVSGAPALYVVADTVTGAPKSAVWQMVTDRSVPVIVAGNTFTLTATNGATLHATVLAPAGAVIATREVSHGHEAYYRVHHGAATFDRTVIDVAGGELFLVAMTLQKGAAPPVAVEQADGLLRARVGGRGIRYDGKTIELRPVEE